VNYEQHKIDVYETIKRTYGEVKAKEFTDFYASRYDKFNKAYVYYKCAWLLYDDYKLVCNSGVRWYAFVGDGGTGKTTIAKNVLSFLDDSFNAKRIKTTAEEIVKQLEEFPNVGAKKSLLLDEPDESIHPNSTEGRYLRSILGKSRQQQLFLGYCATTLSDIPAYIYKKISGIFFTPYLGQALFFKNRPKEKDYVISDIKEKYSKEGYGIFYRLARSKGCLSMRTSKFTPLSDDDELEYLKDKSKDYSHTKQEFLQLLRRKKTNQPSNEREEIIVQMKKEGLTDEQIGKYVGLSRSRITQILLKLVNVKS